MIGFEQNILLKYSPDTNLREVLIASPFQAVQHIVSHPIQKVFATVGLDHYLRIYSYSQK